MGRCPRGAGPEHSRPSVRAERKCTQSCLTLCDPVDCGPPGSSVHGVLQARILEWVATPFFQGVFPTQGLNPSLGHCRQILYCLSRQGSPSEWWLSAIFISTLRWTGGAGGNQWDLWSGFIQVQEWEVKIFNGEVNSLLSFCSFGLAVVAWGSRSGDEWRICCLCLGRARLFATPRTVTRQAPLSVGFLRQEH